MQLRVYLFIANKLIAAGRRRLHAAPHQLDGQSLRNQVVVFENNHKV